MSGLSVGWFHPSIISDRPDDLVASILAAMTIEEELRAVWPFSVKLLGEGALTSMAIVRAPMKIRCEPPLMHDLSNQTFHFVLHAQMRPAVLAIDADAKNTPRFLGTVPPTQTAHTLLGTFELKVGMAYHMDPSSTFHGFTQFPIPENGPGSLPLAVMLLVQGFNKNEISQALRRAKRDIENFPMFPVTE